MTLISMDTEPSMEGIIPNTSYPVQRCTVMQTKMLLNSGEDKFPIHELVIFSKWYSEHRFDRRMLSC